MAKKKPQTVHWELFGGGIYITDPPLRIVMKNNAMIKISEHKYITQASFDRLTRISTHWGVELLDNIVIYGMVKRPEVK